MTEIIGDFIEIRDKLPRNEIVKKVVNKFIETEYPRKGKGIAFRYPVENFPSGKCLYITRPGHKKNFDFKVEVTEDMVLEEEKHAQLALDLRRKEQENQIKFVDFLKAMEEIFHCSENEVDKLLAKYALGEVFETGASIEVLLKVIKWLFIMEDIVYWDVEGRAFLYNYLSYVVKETDEKRLMEAMEKVNDPDRLKSFMKKAGIAWVAYKD